MEISDIRQLIATGNPKLIVHAISAWEKEHSHLPEPILDTLKSENLQVLEAALEALARSQPRVCAPFVAGLMKNEDAQRRRVAVQQASLAMGELVCGALNQLLAVEEDAFVLSAAVAAAGRCKLPLAEIESLLGHQDARVRANTARVVALSGSERIRDLLEPLVTDESIRVQNEAIKGLASLIPEDEIERLVRNRLASGDELVRSSTAFIVAELPLSARVEILAEVMSDESEQVVECAARALASLEDSSAGLVLIERYLGSEESTIEKALISIFAEMPAPEFLGLCEQAAGSGADRRKILAKVLAVCTKSGCVEQYVAWIVTGTASDDVRLRLLSLQLVLQGLSHFSEKTDAIISSATASANPHENALGELLRWRSGKLQGLENLKKMLFSGNRSKIDAAAEVLRIDNGLISRRLLQDAERAGHIKGAGTNPPATEAAKPVILPDY